MPLFFHQPSEFNVYHHYFNKINSLQLLFSDSGNKLMAMVGPEFAL